MKQGILFLLLVIICGTGCKKKEADVLASIRKKTAEINKDINTYTRKTADDMTAGGKGTITGYYKGEEIKKIDGANFTDSNRAFTTYFFDDGMLISAVEQTFTYNKPVTYTEEKALANHDSVWYDDKKTKMETNRYYFNKNKLIKWTMPDGKDMTVNVIGFINKESLLWANAAILLKELKEQ